MISLTLTLGCKRSLSCVLPGYTQNLTLLCLPLLLSLFFFNTEALSLNPSITLFPQRFKNLCSSRGITLHNASAQISTKAGCAWCSERLHSRYTGFFNYKAKTLNWIWMFIVPTLERNELHWVQAPPPYAYESVSCTSCDWQIKWHSMTEHFCFF